jgi:uncharacterized protein YecE (DUF72 family)
VHRPTDRSSSCRCRGRLTHYSGYFNAVEIDSTFYGTPPVERVQRWRQETPDDFKFCPKVPREITHEFELPGSVDKMVEFLGTMGQLGRKLGPILIQWPPSFTIEQLGDFTTFVKELPVEWQFAVEFRHDSWYAPEVLEMFQEQKVALVAVDYVHSPKRVDLTTDFLYIRWLGEHGRYPDHTQEQTDPTPQLVWWWETLQFYLDKVSTIYGFFNNDYAGFSPKTCNRFKTLVGLPTDYPQFPTQAPLF